MEIPKYVELYRKDLELKNYAKTSIENYVSQVKTFLYHYNGKFTEPQKINETAIKDWLLLSNSINGRKHRLSALKLFYKFTIKQPMKFKHIEYPRGEKRLPIIIDQNDIQKMFDVCDNIKHECIMAVLYATGIRINELINIKLTDIESKSEDKAIRIIGKGNKERLVGLSDSLLDNLRKYYKEYKPKYWLFENDTTHKQYTASSVRAFLKSFKNKANVNSPVTPHKYRHSYATALLEAGTDLRIIQELLGHSSSKTTEIYTHVSRKTISKVFSPLDIIKFG